MVKTMKLSQCRTDGDLAEFKKTASPCYIEDGVICLESFSRLKIKKEGKGWRAFFKGRPLNDLYDENELRRSRWIGLLLRFRLLKIRYWRIKLKRTLNESGMTWVFWGEEMLGPFYSHKFLSNVCWLLKDFNNPFDEAGGFEVEGRVGKWMERPIIKREMFFLAKIQAALQCKKWKEWCVALQRNEIKKEARRTEEG